MIPIKNYVSKILFYDKESSYSVITYMDVYEVDMNIIKEYMNTCLEKNEVLHNRVVYKDGELYFEKVESLQLESQYEVHYTKESEFDSYAEKILNMPYATDLQWRYIWCIDKDAKLTRMYFKIHHGYADGYQIIRILTSPYGEENIVKKFNRQTSLFQSLYYILFGFLSLIVIYVKFVINLFFVEKPSSISSENDILMFGEVDFDRIKAFTKEKKITINDFLYSLMISTDKLYNKKTRTIYVSSPINISLSKDTNNLVPILNVINPPEENSTLLKEIHHTFSSLKYSFFIYPLAYLINLITIILPISILDWLYSLILGSSQYSFSNIIGPEMKRFPYAVKNLAFYTTPKANEIIYNIISYKKQINIIITCKKNVILDKDRYKQCMKEAYEALLS